MTDVSWLQVIVLSVVQGLTEFLPVSSSGHLAIVSRLFFDQDAGASFTAVIQIGTELAVVLYFAKDIARIAAAWFAGLTDAERRRPGASEATGNGPGASEATGRSSDYWLGWWVIIGSIPIGVAGLLFKHYIRDDIRNLWIIATALIGFSAVIAAAEYFGKRTRPIESFTWKDAVIVGAAQCLALVPGVSRSGATISAGLFLGQQREAAARFGFLLAIPAVLASGLHELPNALKPESLGQGATVAQLAVGTVIAFVIGYAAVSWFLKFLVRHSMYWFVGYRIAAGATVMALLATGVVAAR